MDHGLTDELREFQDLTRRFVQKELIPHERAVDAADHIDPALRRDLCKRAIEAGLFGFNMPADVGGPGLPYIAQVVIREQLGQVSMPLQETVGRPPRALLACKGEQRDRILYPVLRAEKTTAFALTEPQAGSDAGQLKTAAIPTEGGFLLRGTKHFISHGDSADVLVVIARVPQEGTDGALTAFLVEKGMKGFSVGRIHPTMGWRGYQLAELVFDDCFVPAANQLGGLGEGLRLAMGNINESRVGVAAHCVGMAQRALDLAVGQAKQRMAFNRAIADFQGIQWMLADMAVAIEQSRALVYAAARTMDSKAGNVRSVVSMAKLSATEMVGSVADKALQIFGGSGYMAETPIEMIYRDARAFRIGEGTSEIQRNQIARALLEAGPASA